MKLLLFFCSLFFSTLTLAQTELRLSYGQITTAYKPGLVYAGETDPPKMQPFFSYGVGVIYRGLPDYINGNPQGIWGSPVSIGARLEQMNYRATTNSLEINAQIYRLSAIAGYRVINSKIYLGGIAGLGLLHMSSIKTRQWEADLNSSNDTNGKSYSIGLEGGVNFDCYSVGLEMGQQNFVISSSPEADYSGNYAKVLFGILL